MKNIFRNPKGSDSVSQNTVIKAKCGTDTKPLTSEQFLEWGVNRVAYIKPIQIMDLDFYALHGADGNLISIEDTVPKVVDIARDSSLLPVNIH
jgi:hypothetical protein